MVCLKKVSTDGKESTQLGKMWHLKCIMSAGAVLTDSSTGRGLEHKVLRGHGIGKIKQKASISNK